MEGLAPSPVLLIAARVVQGSAAALMFPQALTGIQLHFAGPVRVRAIGRYAIALSAGAVTGQILGGALISANLAGTGWRAIFLINVPVGVLVLGAASRWLPPDDRRAPRCLDVPGVAVNVTVLARPPAAWALLTLVMTTGSYYTLLFTLSQYLQTGLGDSALVSGLILVPWVAAFGLAGQVARRLPPRTAPMVPAAGCLLLAVAYLAISAALFAGQHGNLLLTVLLGTGGLGLGLQFSTLISHLTTTVPGDYAPDISGVATTAMQIGGALSVAAIGTLYLSLAARPGAGHATHAYAITTVFLGAIALIAIPTARLAIRRTAA
jgi:MFS family permease